MNVQVSDVIVRWFMSRIMSCLSCRVRVQHCKQDCKACWGTGEFACRHGWWPEDQCYDRAACVETA